MDDVMIINSLQLESNHSYEVDNGSKLPILLRQQFKFSTYTTFPNRGTVSSSDIFIFSLILPIHAVTIKPSNIGQRG